MPNWCEGKLRIYGSKDRRDEFVALANINGKVLNTDAFIPYPENFRIADLNADKCFKKGNVHIKDGYNNGGYDWCLENWGTKWGICNPYMVKHTNRSTVFVFETAWSPCFPIVEKMSKMFPTLMFRYEYFEGGVGFRGGGTIKNGKWLGEIYEYDYIGRKGG